MIPIGCGKRRDGDRGKREPQHLKHKQRRQEKKLRSDPVPFTVVNISQF